MGDLQDRRLLLVSARTELLACPDVELRGVPGHVAASWRRSLSNGVRPDAVTTEHHTDLDLGSRLVRCARPVIEQLAEQIGDLPVCVALTDAEARLLVRRDSSSWFGRVADRMHFAQGFGYAEGSVGTNGVGTVLEFGESVHIVGAEHFVESLQPYACAGAPVRDPYSGRIEGVLDVSCLSEHSSPILHSLVRWAAARIEHHLLTDRDEQQQALFDAYSRVDARGRRAVLAVGQRTVILNASMRTLLDPGDLAALQDHARFALLRGMRVDDRVDLPSGTRVRLRGATVTVGGTAAGVVGEVSVLDEVDGAPDPADPPVPARSAPRRWRRRAGPPRGAPPRRPWRRRWGPARPSSSSASPAPAGPRSCPTCTGSPGNPVGPSRSSPSRSRRPRRTWPPASCGRDPCGAARAARHRPPVPPGRGPAPRCARRRRGSPADPRGHRRGAPARGTVHRRAAAAVPRVGVGAAAAQPLGPTCPPWSRPCWPSWPRTAASACRRRRCGRSAATTGPATRASCGGARGRAAPPSRRPHRGERPARVLPEPAAHRPAAPSTRSSGTRS
jgi:hypothetical protein